MFKKGKDRKDLLREITLVQWLERLVRLVGWLAVQTERLPGTHYDFGFNVSSRKYFSKYGLEFEYNLHLK